MERWLKATFKENAVQTWINVAQATAMYADGTGTAVDLDGETLDFAEPLSHFLPVGTVL